MLMPKRESTSLKYDQRKLVAKDFHTMSVPGLLYYKLFHPAELTDLSCNQTLVTTI